MALWSRSALFVALIGFFTIPGAYSDNPCEGMGINVTGTSGTISSANYPNNYENNLYCIWRIETAKNTRIQLRFNETFGVEWSDGGACNYDYIRFGEPYVTWCGTIPPSSYLSATNVLTVTFVADFGVTMTGFSFEWSEIESSVIQEPVYEELTADQGQISSAGYPISYPPFTNHTWKLNVTEGKSILLELEPIFNLEQSRGCIYDYLAVSETDKPVKYFDRLFLCQSTAPRTFYTNVIYIQLWTDSINSAGGFSLNYSAIADPPSCNGITNQTGSSGIIESPMYPNKYAKELDCTWHVTTAENTVIAVRINSNHSIAASYNCIEDSLQIYDGPSTTSEIFQRKYCDYWAPRSFVTTGNALTVRFITSDIADFSHIGFSIIWMAEEKCKSNEFTCWDGSCIHESGKCNTTLDCPNDISDEASCPTNDSVQCGVSEIEPVFKWPSRIIGGHEVVKGSWPWQGNLIVVLDHERMICGTVLISSRWVLTAAHCISAGVPTYTRLGDHDVLLPENEQTVRAERVFLHPKYNYLDPSGFIYGYDIALLYLESPVNYTTWIKPACLPKYEVMDGEDVVMTGWGNTQYGGGSSRILQQVVAPIVEREKCSVILNIPNVSKSLICVGLPYGGASTCNGDSGGPVMALQNGSWVVAGLTSFGSVCGEWYIPGAYTNVHNLLQYIDDVMEIGNTKIPLFTRVIRGETSGVISSLNYGSGNYPQGYHRQWFVAVENGKLIQIRFNETFRIHQQQFVDQCGDYIIIYDGSSTLNRKYGDKKLCGYSAPLDMESESNSVIIEFFSNYEFEDVGFSLTWTAVDGCASDQFRCRNTTCVDMSKTCDDVQDCPTNVDEFVCAKATPGSTECGKSEVAPKYHFSPLLIGGNNAEKGSWPWQVAIYGAVGSSSFEFYCAGTLIADSWVLTARNCIIASSYQVVVGGYSKTASDSPEAMLVDVLLAFRHSGYSESERITEFGLLKLATTLDFTSKWYKPVCLPTNGTENPPPGSTCVVTGWGKTGPSEYLTAPDILRQLQIDILSSEECYGAHPTLICAGYTNRNFGICYDDFGGPLVCQKDGKWIQYGIASFFEVTCGHRSLFERVSLHTNAIVDAIENVKVCKELEIIEGVTTGDIVPPMIKGQYFNDIACSWLIRGPANTLITILFEFFDLEECEFLAWDFVRIYDGNTTLARRVYDATLCGSLDGISGFESSSNEVLIEFYADGSATAGGFRIQFSVVEDCALNQFRCWTGNCIEKLLMCDGKADCLDQSDEKECVISDGECGKQEIVPEFLWHARIAGGHYAKDGSWPFIVQIQDSYFGQFIGTGTIVSERWILTLATSVQSKIADNLNVIVGTNEYLPNEAVRYPVESMKFPPQFWNDFLGAVSLLKLKTTISYSAIVQPACLALPNVAMEPQPGEYCVALGWGDNIGEPDELKRLRQTLVPLLDESVCASKRSDGDSNNTFCSGDIESGGMGTCTDDAGGPVMCFRDNVWVQTGVITNFTSCGKRGEFDIYTKVSYYVDWIEKTMDMTLPKHTARTTETTAPGPDVTSTTGSSSTSELLLASSTSTPSGNTTSTSTPISTETTGPIVTQTVASTTSGGATEIPMPAILIAAVAMIFRRIIEC